MKLIQRGITAYDYSRHGGLDGKIARIGADGRADTIGPVLVELACDDPTAAKRYRASALQGGQHCQYQLDCAGSPSRAERFTLRRGRGLSGHFAPRGADQRCRTSTGTSAALCCRQPLRMAVNGTAQIGTSGWLFSGSNAGVWSMVHAQMRPQLEARWADLRTGPLRKENVLSIIRGISAQMSDADRTKNCRLWGMNAATDDSYILDWVISRIDWIDGQMG